MANKKCLTKKEVRRLLREEAELFAKKVLSTIGLVTLAGLLFWWAIALMNAFWDKTFEPIISGSLGFVIFLLITTTMTILSFVIPWVWIGDYDSRNL